MRFNNKTAVVILNWNGLDYLKSFIPPLIDRTPDSDIWVVDNCSSDASLDWLSATYPEIKQIVLDTNYGFAGGYNKGLEQIDADYYVLLNSDVEVTEGWLDPIINWMDEDRNLAACQPTIRDYHKPEYFEHAGAGGGFIDRFGFPFCAGRIFDSFEKDTNQYGDRAEVFWATGACLVIRADLYHKAGGLDPDFFAHMEEIDLCWRLKNMGYKIGALRSVKVYHVGGGTLQKSNPFKTYLNFRNNLSLLVKNDHQGWLFLKIIVRLMLDGVAFFRFLSEGKSGDAKAVFKAHLHFYSHFPSLLRKRKGLFKRRTNKSPSCRYPRSIVWDYYIKGRKEYSDVSDLF